jgi:uracil-DNA glycosylase
MTNDWKDVLGSEMSEPYFMELTDFIEKERKKGKVIFPPSEEVFSALELTPFDQVKVIILGQDPYHGANQAHGLAFSVKKGIPKPPSLVNIFKELSSDLGIEPPAHGNLESWAKEGVLLLNTVLTVEEGRPASHHNKGWERFTDRIIEQLNKKKDHLVFILWGSPAQKKMKMLDAKKHLILTSPHPSPLSSYRGFFGSKPFSQTNRYLKENGISPLNWVIK